MNTNDGVIEHNINNYDALKGKIFNLIKLNPVTFERSQNAPSVNPNSLQNNIFTREEGVNMISNDFGYDKKGATLKMTMSSLFEMLSQINYFKAPSKTLAIKLKTWECGVCQSQHS